MRDKRTPTGTGAEAFSAEDTVDRLTNLIVRLELAPGSIVSESSLASRLGVPRAEVRDAVQQLREQGLLEVLPRAGIAVTPVAITEIRNVFEARLAIEGSSVRLAAERATADEIGELQGLADGLGRLSEPLTDGPIGATTLAELVDLDRRLHMKTVLLSQNPHLHAAFSRVMLSNSRIWNLYFSRNAITGPFYVSHDALLDAISRRDPDAAFEAVAAHLDSSARTLRKGFDLAPD